MEIYIIRHGETIWNADNRLQGSADIELSAKGRELAGRLGEQLETIEFDAIYSSPLIRAYETACLIRGHRNIPIIRDDRLREMSFGVMEGASWQEWLDESRPQHYFFDAPQKFAPPEGGESFEQVMARTKDFLQTVIEPQWNRTNRIMIVAHGALNKGLMCHIQGNDLESFWGKGLQKNCEADIFTFNGIMWMEQL